MPQFDLGMEYDGKGGMTVGQPVKTDDAAPPPAAAQQFGNQISAVVPPTPPQIANAWNAQREGEGQENAQEGQAQEELLAGKFRSQDDLVKAYQAAERKITEYSEQLKRRDAPLPDLPQTPDSASELFGPVIGDVMEEHKIDHQGMHDRYLRYGRLEPSDEKRLVEAGIEPRAITGYLSTLRADWQQQGMEDAAQAANQLTQAQADAFQMKYGGPEGYKQMSEWAAANLPPQEVESFRGILQSGDTKAIDLALSGVEKRYQAAQSQNRQPTEGRMLGGSSPSTAGDGPFTNQSEAWFAMNDPRYNVDPTYTAKVASRFQGQLGNEFQSPSPVMMF